MHVASDDIVLFNELREALLDDVDALLQLSLRDDQRRREPDCVPMRWFCQQAILGHLKWCIWGFMSHSAQLRIISKNLSYPSKLSS